MIFPTMCFCTAGLITLYVWFSANHTLHFHLSIAFFSFINILVLYGVYRK